MKEYTVTGKIRVTATFMTGNRTMEDVGPKSEPMDKTKARLEKLEEKEEVKKLLLEQKNVGKKWKKRGKRYWQRKKNVE